MQVPQQLSDLGVKERLVKRWLEAAADATSSSKVAAQPASSPPLDFADQQQAVFMALCSTYKDVLHLMRPYPSR